tara:strand:- start:977 stop:1300 length:324 start_codon:yes stop_codon:yes gene_type:complete
MKNTVLTIPQCRERLVEIIQMCSDAATRRRLRALMPHLYRRPQHRRVRCESIAVTPKIVRTVRAFAAAHPRVSQKQMCIKFEINQARVSEILHGPRGVKTRWGRSPR